MNEQSDFERYVADQLSSAAVGTPPESAIAETIERAGGSRRLPAWLALIKEPPMRTNSHVAVGSPTVRVAAVLAATLLLAVALAAAGAGVQRLLAADDPIIVAADGSGDYTTIWAAVDVAEDGDEIQVMPGRYVESVVIDKDITLAGQDDPAAVILDHPGGSPTFPGPVKLGYSELPYGLLLDGTDATVRGLTVVARGLAIAIDGGAPTLEDLIIDDPVESDEGGEAVIDDPEPGSSGAIVIEGGAAPTVRGLATDGWIYVGAADLDLAESGVADYIYLGDGSDSTIRGNDVAHVHAYLATVRAVIEDNDFTGASQPDETARGIYLAVQGDSSVTIEQNRIGSPTYHTAVLVSSNGEVEVRDNTIHESGTAIRFDTGSQATLHVEGNALESNGWGLVIAEHGGAVTVEDNTVEGNGTGIFVNGRSDTTFTGNRVCENETNVLLAVGADAPDPAANEICEDGAR